MFLIYIACLALTALYFFKNQKIKRLKQFTANIPGPTIYPIVGNGLVMTSYKDGILKYLEHAQKKYGTVMRHWIGPHLYVHISDPDDVEIILRDTKNIKKSSTYRLAKPWLGNGLIASTGEHWHNHRKIITPAFHFNILESFLDVFNEKGKILIRLLKNKMGQGHFDIFPFINLYALDAIMETSMGVSLNTQENFNAEYVKAIHSITKIVQLRSYNALYRSDFFFKLSKLSTECKHTLSVINGYCQKILLNRKSELEKEQADGTEFIYDDKKKRDAFLTLLLKGQISGSGFSEEDIKDEVNNFIFGGHDTTSAAIAFGLYHLSRHHDVQQKVYEEIIDLFGDNNNDLTLQDIQKTKYLDQVVKEILRLSPPIPVVSRELEQDLKLKNVTLPKGCAISILIYMLHRNPDHFPNPEVFDPERFSIDKKRHPYSFVPFSAGPRNCIGQKYALLEIKATLIKMLRNFVIFPGEDVVELTFMTLTAANGIKIRLEERV